MNESEVIGDAITARKFSGVETLKMGMSLVALSLKFRRKEPGEIRIEYLTTQEGRGE